MLALGVSFSHREAARRGADPSRELRDLLDALQPRRLRISLYWDEISPRPGVCDLSKAQAALDVAQQRDCAVLLTIGFKPQRHPTYTPPPWLSGASHERLTAGLMMMLERAISLLADYSAIEAWEVEFLPYLPRRLQPRNWAFTADLFKREAGVIREVDPRHRAVVVSHPGGRLISPGWLKALTLGDVLGSALRISPRQALPARRLLIQAQIARQFGRGLWVTELESSGFAGDREAVCGCIEAIQTLDRAGVTRAYLSGFEHWMSVFRSSGQPDCWRRIIALIRED
jgi:hypothetical protein